MADILGYFSHGDINKNNVFVALSIDNISGNILTFSPIYGYYSRPKRYVYRDSKQITVGEYMNATNGLDTPKEYLQEEENKKKATSWAGAIKKFYEEQNANKVNPIASEHYHTGNVDVIQFAEENFTQEELKGFCRINAIKYITRYDKKNGIEDLKKAQFYIDKLINLEEGK